MPDLCFITTCKGRLEHLRQTLGSAAAQPRASCVVVDYSCPDECGTWVEQNYPAVKVVRVPGQAGFNLSRARNLGAQAADAPWLCFFDADVVLDPAFVDEVLPLLRPSCYVRAEPCPHVMWGTIVCARADFIRAGAYDETFQGYGYEDDDLYARLRLIGTAMRGFPARLLREVPHGDDLRVRFHDIKEKALSMTINGLYSRVKIDLMRVTGQDLTPENRGRLYDTLGQFVRRTLAGGREAQWDVPFRFEGTKAGWASLGKLTYVLSPPPNPEPE